MLMFLMLEQNLSKEVCYKSLYLVKIFILALDVFGTVESVKAAADLYAPVGGEINEVNVRLVDSPSLVNEDPYDSGKYIAVLFIDIWSLCIGWIVKLKVKDDSEYTQLMSAEEYEKFLKESA